MNLLFLTAKKSKFINHGLILPSASHCWFARERARSYGNKVWIGQVHDSGAGYSQHIIEVNTDTGSVTANRVGTLIEKDDHNEPSILIRSSDNRLFTCYGEHNSYVIRTRISTNPLDATSWQTEKTYHLGQIAWYTYMSCFQAVNGDIFIISREATFSISTPPRDSWSYIKSTDGGETFTGYTQLVKGPYSCYCNISQSDTDKNILHFIISGHPNDDIATASSVRYFYFDMSDETAHLAGGTDKTANIPLDYFNDLNTLMFNTRPDTGWIEDIITVGGKPRVLMTFIPNAWNTSFFTKELYYTEWTGSTWTDPYKIHTSLAGTVETGTGSDNDFLETYPPMASFHRNNPNLIISGKQVSGRIEIHKLKRISYNSFTSEQLTFNSTYDQWRPITVNSNRYNTFWLNKISYPDYINTYNQELIAATIK